MKIRYADGTAVLDVVPLHQYHREDMPEGLFVMSASSGPKDYVKNDVAAVFDKHPNADIVMPVRGNGPVFLLYRVADAWFDITGRQVVNAETT